MHGRYWLQHRRLDRDVRGLSRPVKATLERAWGVAFPDDLFDRAESARIKRLLPKAKIYWT